MRYRKRSTEQETLKKTASGANAQKEVFTKDWLGVPEKVRWRTSNVRKIKQRTEEWGDRDDEKAYL